MDAMSRYIARQAAESCLPPIDTLLHGSVTGWLTPTPDNIAAARVFLLDKWRERAREQHLSRPKNLDMACKFASVFALCVFGGRMRGNWDHQIVENQDAGLIDLTNSDLPTDHDADWWGCKEHKESVISVVPRVGKWIAEFKNLMTTKKGRLKHVPGGVVGRTRR